VLGGTSAGANCWFDASTTDSFGGLAALRDGLGFLPGSFTPHYDGEALRRPTYRRLIGDGTLPTGYAADDGAAIVFNGTDLAEVVASRPGAQAYHVVRGSDGEAVETPIPARYLG
jgi:peptidase E